MSKTSVFTSITPLPAGVTRQSVLDTYHNHLEMIDLNPLVIKREDVKAPSFAPSEEYYSTWYQITDKVSYLPGNLATGSVTYHACFHDLPDGLQTHVYAPLGLDIRAKWSVGGNMPGEPKQPAELGLGAPREGLYIREDVKMKCNIMMISFVKKTFKESHTKLVDRLVEKAHIIEAKIANERLNGLKTLDPRERMSHGDIFIAPPPGHAVPGGQSQGQGQINPYIVNGYDSPRHTASPNPSEAYNNRSSYVASSQVQQGNVGVERNSYHPGYTSNQQYPPEMLSSARFDPHQRQQRNQQQQQQQQPQQLQHHQRNFSLPHQQQQQQQQGYQPAPVELPTATKGKQESFTAELPA